MNMKTLPMLDHVALWYVRLVALGYLVAAFSAFLVLAYTIESASLTHSLHIAIDLVFAVALVLCSWLAFSSISRVVLAASGFLQLLKVILIGVRLPFALLVDHSDPFLRSMQAELLLSFFLGLTFSFAMLWIAIRMPHIQKHDSVSNPPLQQSC